MKFKKFLLLIILLILIIPNKGYGENTKPKAYLILINKITLEDIELMDNLKGIIKEGNLGLMNTRATSSYLGPGSFLTINSSRKSYANDNSMNFKEDSSNKKINNESIGKLANLNNGNKYMPYIGATGDNLHEKNLKTAIYGNSNLTEEIGNKAALIPMDSKGSVDYGNIENITIEDNKYPFNIRTNYTKLLEEVKNSPGDFIVVDTGDLERIYKYSENLSKDEYKDIRNEILQDIDLFIGDLINIINLENSLLIIISPNNVDINIDSSRLSPIMAIGKNMGKGSLISSTTRRENIISNMDIAPTVMDFLGAPKKNMSGKSIRTTESKVTLEGVIKENKQINTTSKARYKSLLYYGIISILVLLIPSLLTIGKIRTSYKIKEIIKLLLRTLLTMPIIFFIISLLKPTDLQSYIIFLLGFIILSISLMWGTRKHKDQVLYISGFTVILIFLDIILKGKISMYSVLSHDPIIGARYYGIGNEMVGILLGYITIFGKKIIEKNNNTIIPGIIFTLGLILIGNPSMGANVGGTLTFIVALAIYFMEISEIKINYKRMMLIGIFMIILISLIGYVDININKNTTHLGNTILLIKENGLKQVSDIILRKVLMNIKLIGTSFWTYLLLLHMFCHIIIFNLTKAINQINLKVIIAGVSGAMVGFLLNDSGIILAAIAMNIITLELYIKDI